MSTELAKQFHDTYERLAPAFGYETRQDTKDFDSESPNGRLMIAVCTEVLESLRQQLADMTKERDKAKAMPMRYRRMEFNAQLQDENESLRQQLADSQQALRNFYEVWAGSEGIPKPENAVEGHLLSLVEQMRDALEKIADNNGAYGPFPEVNNPLWGPMAIVTAKEALAATADLSGLILCHAVPITTWYGENGECRLPLYRAWEPK